MKIALYCRVSTPEQSVEMQRADLRRYCAERGLHVRQEYCDEGISGAIDRRPALDALMAAARKRQFDVVLVWRFDRFARSTRHLIAALDEFRHLGIEFISFQENIDTSSPLGKALFTIVGAIAELERSMIVERIKGGIRKAREQGRHSGRRPITDVEVLKTIARLRTQGKSLGVIAKAVGLSKSFVHKTCRKSSLQTPEIPASEFPSTGRA